MDLDGSLRIIDGYTIGLGSSEMDSSSDMSPSSWADNHTQVRCLCFLFPQAFDLLGKIALEWGDVYA